jgi:hypothetical protein
MRWRLGGLTVLHWQHFDGDWAVFDSGSGQTLAADPVLAATLMALEGGCETLGDIEAQVRADLPAELDAADLLNRVEEALAFVQQLGLAEVVAP